VTGLALLTVGRPSAGYIADGLADYAGRMKGYGGLELLCVRAAKAVKNRPPAQLMDEEAGRILQKLDPRDMVWALDVAGRPWSSQRWADELATARLDGRRRVVLLVGGHLGFGPAALARADRRVSLGPQTMAHELAALVVAEQIYRACAILAGAPYHRA